MQEEKGRENDEIEKEMDGSTFGGDDYLSRVLVKNLLTTDEFIRVRVKIWGSG
ncbi:hypothetical protein Hanom_Chr01g00053281 [Helianthus anomalus]